mmetsp:Transcript_40281/g.106696  ORF Transcript_40281/g.106696 Transcript_40281/m.106696 type:complete len:234 (+) Transcript_40281:647-1348(+)
MRAPLHLLARQHLPLVPQQVLCAAVSSSELDLAHPAVAVLLLAQLDCYQRIPKLVQHLELAKLMLCCAVCDRPNRHADSGRAARANLLEVQDLLPGNIARLHLDPLVARDLHQHLVRDRWQDRARRWRHVRTFGRDPEEIGHRELLDILLLLGVEVQCGAEARRLGNLQRQQVGRVVAARLHVASASWSSTVVVLAHDCMHALHRAVAEVISDGRNRDVELELRARLQAENGP